MDDLNAIKLRYTFYRDNYRRALRLFLILLLVMVALVAGMLYMLMTWPQPEYYVSSRDGTVKPLTPTQLKMEHRHGQ